MVWNLSWYFENNNNSWIFNEQFVCLFVCFYAHALALYLPHTVHVVLAVVGGTIWNQSQIQVPFSSLLLFTVKDWRLSRSRNSRTRPPIAAFPQNAAIDANCSIFISIYTINCEASSSVHHYIDGTEEHLSPSERDLWLCDWALRLCFHPCWVLNPSWASPVLPAAAPSPINVRLSEEEGVGDGPSAAQLSHVSVIILAVAVLIGAPMSGPAVGD